MDSQNTIHFLQHIAACFPHRPILLLWDRAPWHKGDARIFVETHPQFEMFYFPPGCPDLNPHEHVWKHARENAGHLSEYPNLGALTQAFHAYLETTLFRFDWIAKYLPTTLYASVFI